MKIRPKLNKGLVQIGAIILAFGITSLVLILGGSNPISAYSSILNGAFGSLSAFSDVLVAWVPLLLVTAGLLFTFTAGLWNIGIEGQIVMGGIFSTWALRLLQNSNVNPAIILTIAILGGMAGGALWAILAGLLKSFGGINEIFGGLGLNFVAVALNLWLIFGPWKRPGIASMSGTQPFDSKLWLPTISEQSRLAPVALVLGLIGIIVVFLLLRGTVFGLRLKAVGKNQKASNLLGIHTMEHMLVSFLLCGLFAGLAGAMQVTAVYHRLIPSISSGYGYMGLMVSMLSNFNALVALPVTLFFASLNVGAIQLPIVLKLDSSLSGILQGSLVVCVLIAKGFVNKIKLRGNGF